MPHLPGQVVPAGTFTKPGMTLMDKMLAQALQNVAPVESAFSTEGNQTKQKDVKEPVVNPMLMLQKIVDDAGEVDWRPTETIPEDYNAY